MEPILKVKNLLDGLYTIQSYEPTKSLYGNNYLISAEHELSKEPVKFWSNGFLSDFISSRKPTRKFQIEYVNSKITIPGYSRKVMLN